MLLFGKQKMTLCIVYFNIIKDFERGEKVRKKLPMDKSQHHYKKTDSQQTFGQAFLKNL